MHTYIHICNTHSHMLKAGVYVCTYGVSVQPPVLINFNWMTANSASNRFGIPSLCCIVHLSR